MPPAARVGDQTSHGIPLTGVGSPNVLIGGKPAWRISDFHVCPLFDGKSPHVGGLVTGGCPKLLINGIAATKVGDVVSEAAGPPNTIASGEVTVSICDGAGGIGGVISDNTKAQSSSATRQSNITDEDIGQSKSKDNSREETSYIRGQVLDDSTGEPLGGIPVLITGPGGKRYKATTDDQGFYQVVNVPKGRYDIVVDLEDNPDAKTEVQV